MNCARCGGDWTEKAWHGDKTFPYVAVCDHCFALPGKPDALFLALEPFVGPSRWDPGRPMPTMPDVCAHSVQFWIDGCTGCKRMAGDVVIHDAKTRGVTYSPRFLTETRVGEFLGG